MARISRTAGRAVLALALVVAMAPLAPDARGDFEPIAVADLPAGVADAVKKLCPDGEIKTAKKEIDTDDEGKVKELDFEIEVTLKNGKVHVVEVDTTPEGEVKLNECEAKGPVVAADLPDAVLAALKGAAPEGQVVSGERKAGFDDGKVEAEYRLKLALAGEKTAEVRIDLGADGKVKQTRVDAPIPVTELPKAIVEVLAVTYPDAKVVDAEKRTRVEGEKVRTEYTLKFEGPAGKAYRADVRLNAAGRIRRLEVDED